MKHKTTLLKICAVLIPLVLTSCNLLPGLTPTSRRSKSSSIKDESGNVDRYSDAASVSSECYHKWGNWVTVVEPTCTDYGKQERECEKCHLKQEAVITTRGHTFGEWATFSEATCTSEGMRIRVCSVCHYEETYIFPPLGHNFVALPHEQDPAYVEVSYDNDGLQTEKCSRCNETRINVIPKLQRTFTVTDVGYGYEFDSYKKNLVIDGTFTGFEADTKVAFGLRCLDSDKFLVGSLNPSEEDYKYPLSYYQNPGEETHFVFEFDLSTLQATDEVDIIGTFILYFGAYGRYGEINSFSSYNPSRNIYDNNYRYQLNFNDTMQRFTLQINTIPPYFHLANAELFVKEGSLDHWVRIYGDALDQNKTYDELSNDIAAVTPYLCFNNLNGELYYPRANEWYFNVEAVGNKKIISLYINLQFMVNNPNTIYYLCLNLSSSSTPELCYMEEYFRSAINIVDTNRAIEVFSEPNTLEPSPQNAYGALGFNVYEGGY